MLIRPRVAFRPTTQYAAGRRIEPNVSVPIAAHANPPATALLAPPLNLRDKASFPWIESGP